MPSFSRMIRKNRELSLFLLDVFCVILAYILGFLIRFVDPAENIRAYSSYFFNMIATLPFAVLINLVSFYLLKINRSLWKYTSLDEVGRICFASVVSNFIWFVLVWLVPIKPYIRSVPLFAMMFQMFIMLGLRFLYRWFHTRDLQRQKHKSALIIGAGSAGNLLARDIATNDKYDYRVIGFVDDNKTLTGKRILGIEVLGTADDLKRIVEQNSVDIAFIAMPSASKTRIAEIIGQCSDLNLNTRIMDYTVKENLQEISSTRDVRIEDLLGRDEIKLDMDSISKYLAAKTIMVTGAGGSIGSELVRQILKFHPSCMVLFDIYENNLYNLQQEIIIKKRSNEIPDDIGIVCMIGSVRDPKRLDEVMDAYHPEVVYHAAAHKHVPLMEDSPKEAIKNNVIGTRNVIEACIRHGVKKFILISTDKAVNPTNVMGATKRITELIAQSMKDNGVTQLGAVRFGNVLGSNGSVVPLFKEQIENGGPVTVTDPEIERYFMTIPEAARLVLQAGAYADHGDIFVLDMGTRIKIVTLAERMISLSGFKPYEDIDIQFIGLRPGEKMYEELSLGNEKRYKTANDHVYVNEPMHVDKEKLNAEIDRWQQNMDQMSDQEAEKCLFNLVNSYK